MLVPDRTILLDLNPDEALARATAGTSPDRMESEGGSFEAHVRAGFLEISRINPRRVRVVNAAGSREEVWGRIRATLRDLVMLPNELPDPARGSTVHHPEAAHDE